MNDFLKKIKMHKSILIYIIIVNLSLGIGIIYMQYEEITQIISNIPKKHIIGIIICLPGLFILVGFITKLKFNSFIGSEVNDYYEIAKEAILNSTKVHKKQKDIEPNPSNEININASDIIELMLLNMKEIKEYYVLSKTMAKRSFLLAVIMCIFGFVIISTSIIAIFVIDISFVQSIIPVIGGAVVETIAGTSLVVYRKSLEQLNQYYESLHNNERFLSLVNLVDKLSSDKKDETYINIINNQLEVLKKSQ